MNISELKLKPKLIEITIDDNDVVEKYGEEITFYMYDYIDLPSYFAFFRAQSESDTGKLSELVKTIILNDKGDRAIPDEYEVPIDIFAAAVVKITDHLGKSVTKNSKQKERKHKKFYQH